MVLFAFSQLRNISTISGDQQTVVINTCAFSNVSPSQCIYITNSKLTIVRLSVVDCRVDPEISMMGPIHSRNTHEAKLSSICGMNCIGHYCQVMHITMYAQSSTCDVDNFCAYRCSPNKEGNQSPMLFAFGQQTVKDVNSTWCKVETIAGSIAFEPAVGSLTRFLTRSNEGTTMIHLGYTITGLTQNAELSKIVMLDTQIESNNHLAIYAIAATIDNLLVANSGVFRGFESLDGTLQTISDWKCSDGYRITRLNGEIDIGDAFDLTETPQIEPSICVTLTSIFSQTKHQTVLFVFLLAWFVN